MKRSILPNIVFFILLQSSILFITTLNSLKAQEDPFIWLEQIEGEKQMNWVKEQNEKTLNYLTKLFGYQERYQFTYDFFTSDEQLEYPSLHDGYVYNFWQDSIHQRGLWRRKTLEHYKENSGTWEVLLDLDELSKRDGINWNFQYFSFAGLKSKRCILSLSDGGSDASYLKEFDVIEKCFVQDGFNVPSAKTMFAWINEDAIYIATDFGEGTLTESGYARIVKRWERGTLIDEAEIVFETEIKDILAMPYTYRDKDTSYNLILRRLDFFHAEFYCMYEDSFIKLDVPEDLNLVLLNGELVIHTYVDWKIADKIIHKGDVVSISLSNLLEGNYSITNVFHPKENASVSGIYRAGDKLLIKVMDNIVHKLYMCNRTVNSWEIEEIDLPGKGTIKMKDTNVDSSFYAFSYESYDRPTTLYYGDSKEKEITEFMRLKEYFDIDGIIIEQYFTLSKDGTRVPYFIVHKKNLPLEGKNPLIIYGYGGFQVSSTAFYSPYLGKFWLEKGGVFVLANIRGGGEFGPEWHVAGIRENKQNSYDDFIAITEDLISREITSPEHIGIMGASNGGLLVGAVSMQRPELYEAVACMVPLLDMKRYTKLLSGHSWIAEYGDPDIPEEWAYIKKYSPYHNLKKDTDYPEFLFLTSTRDDRVHPGHARKMTAKMEKMGYNVYLYENTEGGHGNGYTPEQRAKQIALYYSFFIDKLWPEQK